MRASIIVRIKNERENFKKLLQVLQTQTEQDFEVVVVDDRSTDGSDAVAFEYFPQGRVQVVRLERPFNYAYASNAGACAAKGEYLVYVSAHSLPYTTTWLADGLRHFADHIVAGVYAMPIALPDTNIVEKLFINIPTLLFHNAFRRYVRAEVGTMGATNAIFPKALWEQHQFQERYVIGGEGAEWARYFMQQGYVLVHDPAFRVYHSHRLRLVGLIRQGFKYRAMLKPR